jgi:hypothetical protein
VILTLPTENAVVAATSSTDTVDTLKRQLKLRVNLPLCGVYVLRFQGQSLALGDRTLGEYAIPEGATINVLFTGPCLTSRADWSPAIKLYSVLSVLAIDVFLTFESATVELLWPGTYEGAFTDEDDAYFAAEWSRDRHAAVLRIRRYTEKHAARATSRPS